MVSSQAVGGDTCTGSVKWVSVIHGYGPTNSRIPPGQTLQTLPPVSIGWFKPRGSAPGVRVGLRFDSIRRRSGKIHESARRFCETGCDPAHHPDRTTAGGEVQVGATRMVY